MSTLFQDLRLTFRQLSRRPVFAITAVLTLAVGMGVNTVAFTIVNGLLFNGFAASAAAGIGRIVATPGGDEGGNGSWPDYQRFAEATAASLDLAAEGRSTIAWHHDGFAETAWVLYVTPNYFSMVDVTPVTGRIAVERVESGTHAVVIGERFWREKLEARSIAGLTLRVNNTDVSVAGVLPESYTGPAGIYSPDIWLPLNELALFGTSQALTSRDTRWLFMLGRLRPGATVAQLQGQLDTAAAAMARDWPDTHRDRAARFRMLGDGNSERRGLSIGAAIGMGIIGLVLLLACFNVANLLLARAVERERDMGIRTALGARPSRLLRLVLTEGFVIAAVSGGLALVLAWWTQSIAGTFAMPIEQPQHINLQPDAKVVLYVAALILIAGVLPGLWPAMAAGRINVIGALSSHSGTSTGGKPSRLRTWLVAAQIAGSTAFLATAALFIQSYSGLWQADFGFDQDRLVVGTFEPGLQGYNRERSQRYVDAMVDRVRALPGVTDVGVADYAPFFIGFDQLTEVSPATHPCEPETCPKVATRAVSPGYFKTLGVPLVAGRDFEPGDRAAVIINGSLARQYWPDGNGVGQALRIGNRGLAATIVGIIARSHTRGLDREDPTLYLPLAAEHYDHQLSVVARTAGLPGGLVRPFSEAARAIDRGVPAGSIKTMEQRMEVQLWPFRTLSWMFTICGSIALLLATVGLAGVVAHAVSRRIREFGVRLSMGATSRDLTREVLRGSMMLLVPGLITGLLLAAVVARLIQAIFVGVNVLNPATYIAVALVQSVVVAVACLGPALRASRVDPLVALRME